MHDSVDQAHFAVFCDHAEFLEEAGSLPFNCREKSACNHHVDESTSQYEAVVRREIQRAAAVEPLQTVDAFFVHVHVHVVAEHELADHDRKDYARVADMPAEEIIDGTVTIARDEDGGASSWRVLDDSFRGAPVLAALFCHGARG